MQRKPIQRHTELAVYRLSFDLAMDIFELSKKFPRDERYSLTDQIRRASRAVSAIIAEAWRKRRYEASFVNKLNDAEAEAAETQSWLEFAVKCGYMDREIAKKLYQGYDDVIGKLVNMISRPRPWILPRKR
ncbi:MAG: four helix bundle protein [Candidatus Aureabacteria bacterium]|nr:four helix bundle protein [Candidatus Auribacterota bacterium]